MHRMLEVIQRRRGVVNIPFWIARIMGWGGFDMVQKVSFGLVPAMLSRDQVKALREDNVVAEDAKGGFEALGLQPTAMGAILPDYLWRFRPSGQYAAITNSAKNLKA